MKSRTRVPAVRLETLLLTIRRLIERGQLERALELIGLILAEIDSARERRRRR